MWLRHSLFEAMISNESRTTWNSRCQSHSEIMSVELRMDRVTVCDFSNFGPDKSDKESDRREDEKNSQPLGYLVVLRWRHYVALQAMYFRQRKEENGTRHPYRIVAKKTLTTQKAGSLLRRSLGLCPLLGDLLSHSTAPSEYGLVKLLPGVRILAVNDVENVKRQRRLPSKLCSF